MSEEEWNEESTSFFDSFSAEERNGKSERKKSFEKSVAAKQLRDNAVTRSEAEKEMVREKAAARIAASVAKNASKKEILKVAQQLKTSKNVVEKYLIPTANSSPNKTSSGTRKATEVQKTYRARSNKKKKVDGV